MVGIRIQLHLHHDNDMLGFAFYSLVVLQAANDLGVISLIMCCSRCRNLLGKTILVIHRQVHMKRAGVIHGIHGQSGCSLYMTNCPY